MQETEKHKLTLGRSLVQLNPRTVRNLAFARALLVITELKSFGVLGYAQVLGTRENPGGRAFYSAHWDEFEYVGEAVWGYNEDEGA